MQWIIFAIGLIGCAAFCWHVLREDRRSVRAHRERRERLRLVPADEVTSADTPDGPEAADRQPVREAA